jgi:LysM repeat protein
MDIDPLYFSPEIQTTDLSPQENSSLPEIPILFLPEKSLLSFQAKEEIAVDEPPFRSQLPLDQIKEKPQFSRDFLPGPHTEDPSEKFLATEGNESATREGDRKASMEGPYCEKNSASQLFFVNSRIKMEASRLQCLFGSPFFSPSLSSPRDEGLSPGRKRPFSEVLALFPSLLHERVRHFIQYFQTHGEEFFSASLARSWVYEPMMKGILREKNLPEELFYLALIESGYKPHAQSNAKATGIWQLMPQTARRFGLQVNRWIDERRDPEKSTQAAAEYLKSLYELFQCWDLAAASYNAGEGKILSAMKKTNSQNFWQISRHRYLKQETKKYVPKFLAVVTIARNPRQFGFSKIEGSPPMAYEKVLVPPGTRLDRIARAAETKLTVLRSLNPALIKWQTPPNGSPLEIRIPLGKKEAFENNFHLKQNDIAFAKKHRIRPGETLWHIARRYQINLRDLCEFNQIAPKALIHPGVTLLLPP